MGESRSGSSWYDGTAVEHHQRSEEPAVVLLRNRHETIGSGAVEASAKHLVQHRMKRTGSRWSDLGARAILDLRGHLLSGRPLDRVTLLPTNVG